MSIWAPVTTKRVTIGPGILRGDQVCWPPAGEDEGTGNGGPVMLQVGNGRAGCRPGRCRGFMGSDEGAGSAWAMS